MIALRLFDPSRIPTDWTEIIRPEQYVAFAKLIGTGAPCDADGRTFPETAAVTCLLFDSLSEAESYCRQQVARAPDVRFEIFDSSGRANPPLLVLVHPAKTAALEGNPRGIRLRAAAATTVLIVAAVSFWYDFTHGASARFFPTLLGINLVVVAARLIQLNKSYQHSERVRRERLAQHQKSVASLDR